MGISRNLSKLANSVDTSGRVGTTGVNVDLLPAQTGYAGKYLKTDGTAASWQEAASGGAVALNSATISANYSIPTGSNGFTVGPVIVANGVSVSIASGQRWVIV